MTIKANSIAIPVGFNPRNPASVAAAVALLPDDGLDTYSLAQAAGLNLIGPALVIERLEVSSGSAAQVVDYSYALTLPAETFELASGGFIEVSTSEPINVPAVTVTDEALPPTIQTASAIVEVPAASVTVEALAPEILTATVVEIPAVIRTATALAPEVVVVELVVIQVPAVAVSMQALAPEVVVEAAAWTPAELTTTLWLDAADATTITESGGSVSEWQDKSGNVRHASQGASDRRPTVSDAAQNGLDALSFDGTDDFFSLASALPLANSGSFDVYFAGRPNHPGDTRGIIRNYPSNDGAGSWGLSIGISGQARLTHHITSGNNSTGGITSAGVFTADQSSIASFAYNTAGGSTSAQRWILRHNAGAPLSETAGNTGSNYGAGTEVGRRLSSIDTDFYKGLMYEIIITSAAATTEDRQRVEGYLAHKWGLTASLPADHPYKTTAP
jgi:hypothetical protein